MPTDLEFAPQSYFSKIDLETRLKSTIFGQKRKETVLENTKTKFTAPFLLRGQISDSQRSKSGAVHPKYMGGEYLPNMEQNEVEICRVILQSTTLDVTSMRANLNNGLYSYSVSDEYDLFKYQLPIQSSKNPLATGQMIEQIDNCLIHEVGQNGNASEVFHGLTTPVLTLHIDGGCDPKELIDYISVDSAFYPELGAYYKNKINNYLLQL